MFPSQSLPLSDTLKALFVALRVKVPNAFRPLQLTDEPVTETVAEVSLTVPASENNSDSLNVPLPVMEEPDWLKVYIAELSPLKPFQVPEKFEILIELLEVFNDVNAELNDLPLQSEPLIDTLSEL